MFFLTLVVLQWFPEYQYVDPIVAALPLIIIVALTAAKDGVEDYRRHKTDSQVNSQITKTMKKHRNVNAPFHAKEKDILSNFSVRKKSRIAPEISSIIDDIIDWDDTEWKDIKVGDFILLKNNELIPADIIVMSTSDQDGMCYIESKNLDGETNLKIKRGIVETSFLNTTAECCFFGCYIDTEAPTPNLFTFSGNLTIPKDYMNYVAMKTENFGIECAEFDPASNENSGEEGSEPTNNNSSTKSDDLDNDSNFYDEIDECIQVPLNFNNILLRGCIIRNTDWIIGVIVATGTDTKLSLNGGDTPSKRSLIEKKMNPQM